jgi:mRNA interferase YafQ
MYEIFRTTSFKKDYKKLSNVDKKLLKEVITLLANGETLAEEYNDHKLIGNYLGCRECHIKPDLLLIYRINDNILELALTRVGSHSKLFGK